MIWFLPLTLSDFLSRFGRRFRRTFVLFEERGQTKAGPLMTAFWLRQQGENFNMRGGHRNQTTYAVAFFPISKLTPLGLEQRRTCKINSLITLWHSSSFLGIFEDIGRDISWSIFPNFFIRLHILLMLLKKFFSAAFLKQSSILKPLNFMSLFPTFFLSNIKFLCLVG